MKSHSNNKRLCTKGVFFFFLSLFSCNFNNQLNLNKPVNSQVCCFMLGSTKCEYVFSAFKVVFVANSVTFIHFNVCKGMFFIVHLLVFY